MEILPDNAINAIADVPGLYISDITVPRSPDLLREHGITHVLSLTNKRILRDLPNFAEDLGVQHLHIDIEDNPYEDLLMALEGLCAWIDDALHPSKSRDPPAQPNPRVLVHCLQGISRSGAIIIAYVMHSKSIDYDAALALVQKSRSVVAPNSGFADQLRLWRQMEYSIYEPFQGHDDDGTEQARKTKQQYEDWKANRGILMSTSEQAKQDALRHSMAEMAVRLKWRRLELKKLEDSNASED